MYRPMTIHPPGSDDFDEILKALANPVRRKILAQMKDPARNFPGQEHPYELGVCAGKIDDSCGLSQSTVSAHLAVLLHAGLLTSKRVGQWIYYKRNEAAIAALLARMSQDL
jgi:DNA-binding transcriptional ArsR family regulator